MLDILKHQHSIANDNAKLIITTFTAWFTFFWTLNIAALGFIYKDLSTPVSPGYIVLSIIFVLLNIIGIGVCHFCWKSMCQLRNEAIGIADRWSKEVSDDLNIDPSTGLLPKSVWSYVFAGSGMSLLLNISGWILLPILSQFADSFLKLVASVTG